MAQKKTILIIDDHPVLREGLKTIIRSDTRLEVIGDVGNGHEGLRIARELKPDLVLMDISLPDQSGIQLTGEIRKRLQDTQIIIISMHSKIDYIVNAFKAGAKGYIVKESAAERLLHGIDAVLKGDYYMDSAVSHKVVETLMQSPEKDMRITDSTYDTLTSREQEIMVLLAEGFSPKEISEKLFISPKTVENHRTSIMRKLNLHSNHQLVRYAAKLGLIDVDLWKE